MQSRRQGLYIISVAAQILDMHPQTLRKYERAGFIEPPRLGTLRLYSDEDIARLRLIKHLVDELGLNLAASSWRCGTSTGSSRCGAVSRTKRTPKSCATLPEPPSTGSSASSASPSRTIRGGQRIGHRK